MNEGEIKFKNDLRNLVFRALRAGATPDSVEMVLRTVFNEIEIWRPYQKAMLEKDLAP